MYLRSLDFRSTLPAKIKTMQPKKSLNRYLSMFSGLLLGVGLVSCRGVSPSNFVAIPMSTHFGNVNTVSEIKQNKIVTNIVHLRGQVSNRAPFLGNNGAYELQDESGKIWVITDASVPNLGDEVLIQGQAYYQSIPVAGQELGEVYVQEEQLLERKAGRTALPVAVPALPEGVYE
ncbi:MAG: hypothetical protein KME06_01205 [Kastovskya adunca ATA6-11-RM4]|nr:hypothetical protein [Kastovskya adunca ATA6-11-RM4]